MEGPTAVVDSQRKCPAPAARWFARFPNIMAGCVGDGLVVLAV